MKIIIDRFEGDYAVVELEDKSIVDMPIALVPQNATEGDVIEIKVDMEETESRKKRIEQLMKDLWEDE
ncbi:DUF3006 domain-containing protein [Natronincola ferrireducens]|uniref:DUF3006 domain-containing protein n=1 Tax=Natronincola ferrireducens TaxID=393762 RepID=A0A1G9A5I7_9FIRM|nr:DUF3006 domain-containing protein [Natronincola ferrireducens]SDK22596.1 Protein of unknown function [Natronincola ferrireducens]